MSKSTPSGIGLVIIGSEILDGRRQDKHFHFCRDLLAARHLPMRYALTLADDPPLIEAHLRWCMAQPEPFFCCGGIGATPDDHTRGCAARAAGLKLETHAEGLTIIARRLGKDLNPARCRLVEFPAGATLIPNPINQVPGFSIRNGHFVPGFPEMAQAMMTWVLDTYYAAGPARVRHTVLLPGAREGDLAPLMERFVAQFPDLSFSSLPRFTESGGTEVELSIQGEAARADTGLHTLRRFLHAAGVPCERESTN
jgi:molybdopterin-biosynthesis enzyme MoeA-like protein